MAEESTNKSDGGQEATDGEIRLDGVQALLDMKEEARQARLPREQEWNRNWNLYNNQYDFGNKAPWQSKNYLSRINTSVRVGAGLIKSGLVGPQDFFETMGYGDIGKRMSPSIHKLTKFMLDSNNFVNNYHTALISGMLSSLVIMKVYPRMIDDIDYNEGSVNPGPALPQRPSGSINTVGNILAQGKTTSRRKIFTIKYDPVNAYHVYLDPFGDGLYIIHEISMDYHQFMDMAEDGHFEAGIAEVVRGEYFSDHTDEDEEALRKGQLPSTLGAAGRRRVRLDEFWGTLIDPNTGRTMFRNAYGVMVNEKYWARSPRPNPMPTKTHPFVIAPLIQKPFSVWHQGFVESVTGLQVMLTELMNLFLDANLYSTVKAFELDIDQVYDPTQFQDGIYPGKTYKKRSGGMSNSPMIRDIQIGQMPAQSMEIFMAMSREYDNALGMNEFMMPQMRVRAGRVSATEASQKGENSTEFFNEMSKGQELNFLEPLLHKSYMYMLHYMRDFSDPLLQEVMGVESAQKAQIMLANPEIVHFLSKHPAIFKAQGLSRMATRFKDMEKIMAFINMVGNVAKGVPQILQMINLPELLSMATYALGWDATKVLTLGDAAVPPTNLTPNKPPTGGGGAPPLPTTTMPDINGNGSFGVTGPSHISRIGG